MRLCVLLAKFDAAELHQEAVPDVIGICSLVCLRVIQDAQLDHLRISHIVQSEQIGPSLLERRGIFTHGGRGNSRQQLAGAVPEALVQVGVDLICIIPEFTVCIDLRLVVRELLEGILRTFKGCHVVGVGDVGDGHRLGAIVPPDPVRVRQVDADRSGRVCRSRERDPVDDLRGDTLDFLLAEPRVDRGIVLEPLGVRTQDLRPG